MDKNTTKGSMFKLYSQLYDLSALQTNHLIGLKNGAQAGKDSGHPNQLIALCCMCVSRTCLAKNCTGVERCVRFVLKCGVV